MKSRLFDSFREASAFAKSLGQQQIKHNLKCSDSSWLVEYDKLGSTDSHADVDRLRKQIDEKDFEINRLKVQLKKEQEDSLCEIETLKECQTILEKILYDLQSHIEDEIANKTKDANSRLEKERFDLSEKLVQLKEKENNLVGHKHKLDLLEKAYAERFGEADVKIVKEQFNSTDVCPRCGGDGGIRGGCQKCDGKGWIDVIEEKLREVVTIK